MTAPPNSGCFGMWFRKIWSLHL